jgi:transaldolase
MRLFIDTGSVAEVEEIAAWGVLSGATTNPPAGQGGERSGEAIKRICELVDGDVSAEVVSRDAASMVTEGRALRTLHENVIVKVPFSAAGLEATRVLVSEGHKVNMTLVFSATQALLTAEAGASYISCFMGRPRRHLGLLRSSRARDRRDAAAGRLHRAGAGGLDPPPEHVVTAARLGCEVATVPGQGAQAAAEPPAHHRGHRQVRSRLEVAPEFAEWLQGLVQAQTTHA